MNRTDLNDFPGAMPGDDSRPWLASYPAGVPAEPDLGQYASLVDFLEAGFRHFADRTAYISFGVQLSYGELEQASRAFAAWLQSLPDLQPGARVALMLPNCLQYPIALFGLLRAGMVGVNCNPLFTARELRQELADSGASVVLVLENFAHTLEQALPGTGVRHMLVTGPGDALGLKGRLVNGINRHWRRAVPSWSLPGSQSWRQVLARGQRLPLAPVHPEGGAPALLQYTGGTTGTAKGAVLSHANLLANIAQARAWIQGHLREDGSELVVTALPLYHIFALTANCFTFFGLGAANLLIPDPRDIPGLVASLRRHPFTVLTGVNTLFNALLDDPGFASLDFSRLRITLGGGMAVQRTVAERWRQVTGHALIEAYGLTEASPAVTINPFDQQDFSGSIGLPLPGTRVDIRDEAGRSLPRGEVGEICVQGPQVMGGYWQRPDEDALVFCPDGFLRTGDLGRMDRAGYVWLVDRKKDTILVSGFNVYPNEVEEVLAEHPGVLESAAVGIPDQRSGEAVKVVVVRRDPNLSETALVDHCRAHLAAYKVPHRIEFRERLPKNAVGKILRRQLRESLESDGRV